MGCQGKKYSRDGGRLEGQGTGHCWHLWAMFSVRDSFRTVVASFLTCLSVHGMDLWNFVWSESGLARKESSTGCVAVLRGKGRIIVETCGFCFV